MSVRIEFIASSVISSMTSGEKVDFILKSVRKDTILVLEEPLSREEEKALITQTMKNITTDFPGIEVSTLGPGYDDLRSRLIKLLGGRAGGLTVVGPSNLVKQIKKDPDKIRLLAGK
ncbi:MAG: DUF2073 domain-containing protein [Candidatus Micrarchaeota archaeon]